MSPLLLLRAPIGDGLENHPDDLFRLERAFADAGDAIPAEGRASSPFLTTAHTSAVQNFQARNGLLPDGILHPGGPTEAALNNRLLGKPPGGGLPSRFRLRLAGDVGEGLANDRRDVINAKRALGALGYMPEDPFDEPAGFIDAGLASGLHRFQRDRNLPPDGVATPNGPTEQAVNAELARHFIRTARQRDTFAGRIGQIAGGGASWQDRPGRDWPGLAGIGFDPMAGPDAPDQPGVEPAGYKDAIKVLGEVGRRLGIFGSGGRRVPQTTRPIPSPTPTPGPAPRPAPGGTVPGQGFPPPVPGYPAEPPKLPERPQGPDPDKKRDPRDGMTTLPGVPMPFPQLPGFMPEDRKNLILITPIPGKDILGPLIVENRQGSESTQFQVEEIARCAYETANELNRQHITQQGGARRIDKDDPSGPASRGKETSLSPGELTHEILGYLKGKLRGGSYSDLHFENAATGRNLHINTVDLRKSGRITSRELRNAIRLLCNAKNGDIVLLIPKAPQGSFLKVVCDALKKVLKPLMEELGRDRPSNDPRDKDAPEQLIETFGLRLR